MDIPARLHQHVGGWRGSLAWQSAPDALTWRLTGPAGQLRYLKTASAAAAVPLRGEAARLRWARASGLPVPAVVAACRVDQAEWLLTEALPGVNATAPELMADPRRLVQLLASGLRRFHAAPAADCPFRFGVDEAIAHVARRVRTGLIAGEDLHPEHAHLSPADALDELYRLRPGSEDLVVCHGDYCLPNVLLQRGEVTGFVDLGELAVADCWFDLATATWSVSWNLGPGWEDLFLSSYGVERDDRAIAFYRLVYDLMS